LEKPSARRRPKSKPSLLLTCIIPMSLFACALLYVSIYADVSMWGLEHARLKAALKSESNINTRLTVQAQSMVSAERAKDLGMQAGMRQATRFDHLRVPEKVASAETSVR
jgi:hypothetical protein